jgi:hypothetical protein
MSTTGVCIPLQAARNFILAALALKAEKVARTESQGQESIFGKSPTFGGSLPHHSGFWKKTCFTRLLAIPEWRP